MTLDAYKQRIQAAAEGFFENQERERLGLRKKRQYVGSEASEQAKLAAWLDAAGILWCHPANERKATARQHAVLANQGVKAGLPDVLIFSVPTQTIMHHPSGGLIQPRGVAIELKRVSQRATVSVAQLQWLDALKEQGWLARVCQGASEATRWLESLGFVEGRGYGR